MFVDSDEWDIGIMMIKGKVNNTVILVNINALNDTLIEQFFERRLALYYDLPQGQRVWGGDQNSICLLLQLNGVLPEQHNTSRIYDCMGLRIKLFDYGTNGISGLSKSGAVWSRDSVFIDFKGPKRKRFFNKAYTILQLQNQS